MSFYLLSHSTIVRLTQQSAHSVEVSIRHSICFFVKCTYRSEQCLKASLGIINHSDGDLTAILHTEIQYKLFSLIFFNSPNNSAIANVCWKSRIAMLVNSRNRLELNSANSTQIKKQWKNRTAILVNSPIAKLTGALISAVSHYIRDRTVK